MNTTIKIIAATLLITLASCTDAKRSKIMGYGDQFRVESYSGGTKIGDWISSGKVLSQQSSDGYYFNCSKTGKLIEVSSDIVITEQ